MKELFDAIMLFIVLLTTGILGMIAHYAKKAFRHQTDISFFDYVFKVNSQSTIAAFGSLLVAIFTLLGLGILDGTSWMNILGVGFTTGYTLDSAINSDRPFKETKNLLIENLDTIKSKLKEENGKDKE